MDLPICQSIVQSFFLQHAPTARHSTEQNLTLNGRTYPVRPDDTYALSNALITIEYENAKRPVESITKYWWLLAATDWLTHGIALKCIFLPLGTDFVRSRIEVIPILGHELVAKYPGAFEFFFLMPDQLTTASIHSVLAEAL